MVKEMDNDIREILQIKNSIEIAQYDLGEVLKEQNKQIILSMNRIMELEKRNLDKMDYICAKNCKLLSQYKTIELGELVKRAFISFNKEDQGKYAICLEKIEEYGEYLKFNFKLNNQILEKIYNITSETEETFIIYKDGRIEVEVK